MSHYGAIGDDFYVNMQLNTVSDLPPQRESMMHFFEQVQRRFPLMRSLVPRDREFFLEEPKEEGNYRWTAVDARRISSGFVNPSSMEEAFQMHKDILGIIPYSMSVSHLDCESLNIVFGFDFTYRGNHNLLLATTLGMPPVFDGLLDIPGVQCMGFEPSIQLTLDPEMRTQCRISFECRSTPFHMRSGEFPEEQLSVYLALRKVDSLGPGEKFETEFQRLADLGKQILDDYVVGNILQPLHQAIAIQ